MKNYKSIALYRGGLRITDLKNIVVEIIEFIIRNGLLIHDRGRPYLNCGSYYLLLKPEELTEIICFLIHPEQASQIPTRAVDEAVKRLLRHPGIMVDMEAERQRSEHLVNVQNGIFDCKTGEFTTDRMDYKFDYQLDFEYQSGQNIFNARNFVAFISSSLGQAFLDCIERMLGYIVSSLILARVAFLLIGIGATGKSTLLEFIEHIVGTDHCSHVPFHRVGNMQARAEYYAKRLNISRDNSQRPMKDEDAFKNLVSCEMVTARFLYENAFDFVPRLKMIFASNVPMNFAHADDAVYDRLMVVPFEKEIPNDKRDRDLLTKLLQERDIIFSVALDQLPDLIHSGYDFMEPERCKRIIDGYRAALHTAEHFLNERCILSEKGTVSSVLLYKQYCSWCAENGLQPDGQKTFYARVRTCSAEITEGKVNADGSRVNGFRGIALKQADEAKTGGKQAE